MDHWAVISSLFVGLIAALISSGKLKWLYVLIVTAPRDLTGIYRIAKFSLYFLWLQYKNTTVADLFLQHVARTPNKPCLVIDEKVWTFKEVNTFSNRIANTFNSSGYKKGDVVALMLENGPEFVATWLGLSKLGVITALINTNQRQKSLQHSLEITKCKAIIFGEIFKDTVSEIYGSLPKSLELYQYNEKADTSVLNFAKDLTKLVAKASTSFCKEGVQEPGHSDILLYIYTSGTTGLPKAAIILNSKYIYTNLGFGAMCAFNCQDVIYTPLPLYHSAGGGLSVGQALLRGCTVVLRKKFSASQYFADCRKYGCTIGHYIGEMCRYMLATNPASTDKEHTVRMMFGNGLRPQIWQQFLDRFNIKAIREFYGSTEGNTCSINLDGKVGAVGYVPTMPLVAKCMPITLIKADQLTGELIRGPEGLCEICGPYEPGACIGRIKKNIASKFVGYVDKSASAKKIVRDIFQKGDSAFLSGDILEFDEFGYLYFKDRTGDTFRWKGENVSTCEVEALVSNVAGYRDTMVYGVKIENMEGRAGMAAILDPKFEVDLKVLGETMKSSLPAYARPKFIRILTKVDMTGTFKMKKLDLQTEGFNPELIKDPLYYLTKEDQYQLLTKEIYEKIRKNEIWF